jgi:hypothetical protein|nr:MAG TPA: Sodium/potassium-transporting ATPase subunit alpha-1 [Caudoviricetes sp.]
MNYLRLEVLNSMVDYESLEIIGMMIVGTIGTILFILLI